jgi:hypothetical protein
MQSRDTVTISEGFYPALDVARGASKIISVHIPSKMMKCMVFGFYRKVSSVSGASICKYPPTTLPQGASGDASWTSQVVVIAAIRPRCMVFQACKSQKTAPSTAAQGQDGARYAGGLGVS